MVLPSFYFWSICLTNSCPLTVYPARCWPLRGVKRSWPSSVDGVESLPSHLYSLKQTNKNTNKNQPNLLQDDRIQLHRFTLLFRPCESLSASFGCAFWECREQARYGPMIQCYSRERRSLIGIGIFQSRKTTGSVQRLSIKQSYKTLLLFLLNRAL